MKKSIFNHFAPEALRNFLLAGATFVAATNAYSQSTWKGTTSSFWNVADNWSPSGVPSSVAVTFDGTGTNLNTTLGASFIVSSLTIGQAAVVTINAGASQVLTVNTGSALSVSGGSHKFVGPNANVGSGATADWSFAGASNYILSVSGGASFEIAGRLGASASKTYNKQGSGTLILSGNNGGGSSWVHGGFLVSTGVLRFAAANAAGNSGNSYTVNNTTALEIQGGVSQSFGAGIYTLSGNGISSTGALRSISGANSFTCTGAGGITLATNSSIGVDADTLTIAAVIKGSAALTKVGNGTLSLSSANIYTGSTSINGGSLRLGNANAIPGGIAATGGTSNLIFSGTTGAVGLTATSGDFLRTVGTGVDQVTANPTATSGQGKSMGFAAYGGNRNVNFGATMTLSSVSLAGQSLLLGSADSDSKVTVVSGIDLSNGSRTVTVADGSASVDAEISGVISSSVTGSIVKSGAGTLSLTGTNTYRGSTTVLAGTLAINGSSLADASTLIINGGKVELTGAETVDKLYVGATQLNAGTYSFDGAGATIANANLTGTGTLIVTSGAGNPFAAWTSFHALTGTDALPGADVDNDGLQNTLEFVLGGNPKVSDNSTVGPVLTDGASAMTLTFNRSDESELQPVPVTVQVSADLGTWNPADDIAIGATNGSGPNGTTYTVAENGSAADSVIVTIPKNSSTKLFTRIQAIIP